MLQKKLHISVFRIYLLDARKIVSAVITNYSFAYLAIDLSFHTRTSTKSMANSSKNKNSMAPC